MIWGYCYSAKEQPQRVQVPKQGAISHNPNDNSLPRSLGVLIQGSLFGNSPSQYHNCFYTIEQYLKLPLKQSLNSQDNQHPPTTLHKIPHIPTNRDHKALNRSTLGGLGTDPGMIEVLGPSGNCCKLSFSRRRTNPKSPNKASSVHLIRGPQYRQRNQHNHTYIYIYIYLFIYAHITYMYNMTSIIQYICI